MKENEGEDKTGKGKPPGQRFVLMGRGGEAKAPRWSAGQELP